MPDRSDWDSLDRAAFRVSMKRSVRRLAWFEAAVGAFAAACGIAAPLAPLVVIGIVLFLAGAWNLFRTSIHGMLVDGIAVIATGVFSMLAGTWMEDTRPTAVAKGIFAGAMQVVWGVRRLALYRTVRTAVNDPDAIAHLESIVRDLEKRNPKSDPSVVEFRTGPLGRYRNRLGLYEEGVVGLLEGRAVRLDRRTDVWIETRGTGVRSSTVNVRVQMSDLELNGSMAAEYLQRFENWKLGMWRPGPIAA